LCKCDKIPGKSMLDKYRKELGSEVELLPEGKHFNKFCINLRFRKEKQMSMSNHDRILYQTKFIRNLTSVYTNTYPCFFFYFSYSTNIYIFPL